MGRRKKNVDEPTPEARVEPVVIEEPKPVEPVALRVYVSDGKCINCRRGVLKPGTEVFAKDFPGGEATIEEHLVNGGLVKR